MVFDFTQIIPILKSVMSGLGKLFMALFLTKVGSDKEKLKQSKEVIQDAQDAQKIRSNVSRLSDDDLDKLL